MHFALKPDNYAAIVRQFADEGFVVLTDVDPRAADLLRRMIGREINILPEVIQSAGLDETFNISVEQRTKLARPVVTDELRDMCFDILGELLLQLIGPVIHTSSTFHPQIKNAATTKTVLHGYSGDGLEVQALYGLHSDFTAARVLTSPSALVCWIPLTTCEGGALRIYPKSHKLGLVTNRWLPSNVERVDRFGEPVEISAVDGQILLFNFLTIHGSARPTRRTRISCDLRFFPYCAVFDSAPVSLVTAPNEWIRNRLEGLDDGVLCGPLLESLAYAGNQIDWPNIEPHSVLNHAKFIEDHLRGHADLAEQSIRKWVNVEVGFDPPEDYWKRFAELQLYRRPYEAMRGVLPNVDAMLSNPLICD